MITDNDNEGHNYILIIAPLDNYHHLPAVRLNAVIIRLRNVSFLHTFPSTSDTSNIYQEYLLENIRAFKADGSYNFHNPGYENPGTEEDS